jgi:hypothetical protein
VRKGNREQFAITTNRNDSLTMSRAMALALERENDGLRFALQMSLGIMSRFAEHGMAWNYAGHLCIALGYSRLVLKQSAGYDSPHGSSAFSARSEAREANAGCEETRTCTEGANRPEVREIADDHARPPRAASMVLQRVLAAPPTPPVRTEPLCRLCFERGQCHDSLDRTNNPRAAVREDGTPSDPRHPWNADAS